jgi:hypothetical protein
MTLALLITIGVIVYFIIGRTVINIFEEYDFVDAEDWKFIAVLIFPLVAIWVLVMQASEYLSDVFTELMTGKKRNKW